MRFHSQTHFYIAPSNNLETCIYYHILEEKKQLSRRRIKNLTGRNDGDKNVSQWSLEENRKKTKMLNL